MGEAPGTYRKNLEMAKSISVKRGDRTVIDSA
jgi:hypothetical protein